MERYWYPVSSLARQWGFGTQLLEALIDKPDLEWLMIDATYVKVHQHDAGAVGGNRAVGRTRGGQHQTATGRRCPRDAVNLLVTAGTAADCTQAEGLLDGIPLDDAAAEYLLADRGMTPIKWRQWRGRVG